MADSVAPSPVSELVDLLSLERLEVNLFRGQSRDIGTKYVFGGQVLGQALSAAQATLDNLDQARTAHSTSRRQSSTRSTAPATAAASRCAG
jgi:acyl-CoA thioesterase